MVGRLESMMSFLGSPIRYRIRPNPGVNFRSPVGWGFAAVLKLGCGRFGFSCAMLPLSGIAMRFERLSSLYAGTTQIEFFPAKTSRLV